MKYLTILGFMFFASVAVAQDDVVEQEEEITVTVDEACKIFLCMTEEAFTNEMAAESCVEGQEAFFQTIDWDGPVVDMSGTIKKRYKTLERCEGADSREIVEIMEVWSAIIDPTEGPF